MLVGWQEFFGPISNIVSLITVGLHLTEPNIKLIYNYQYNFYKVLEFIVVGGPHSTVDSIIASRPAALGSILGVPKIFSEKILDVVEIY